MTDEQVLTAFFAACSIICWLNLRALIRDRSVKGVSTVPTWVFLSTNLFEVYYFFNHDQWFAMTGAVLMSLANWMWLSLYGWLRLTAHAERKIERFPLDFEC